jgi:hypothetical protein
METKTNNPITSNPKYFGTREMRGVCPKQNQKIQEAKEQFESLRPYDILKEIFSRIPEGVSQRA